LDYLEKIKDPKKKFDILLKYGQKFLGEESSSAKTLKLLKSFIDHIINLKKTSNDNSIKYEDLIKVFINKETSLEELLDYIIKNDENCDSAIFHRRIELYLDKLVDENKQSSDSEYPIKEAINSLLKNKKIQNKIDKNHILMLFKINNFTQGIVTLSEIMELRQELLSIYMDNHQYDKIINICENFGRAVKLFLIIYNRLKNFKFSF
jgi:hypothetical protein